MEKNEVIERLCALCSEVGEKVFNHEFAHDCFCGQNISKLPFEFNEQILSYIEKVVKESYNK
jgi:hypothetical protein